MTGGYIAREKAIKEKAKAYLAARGSVTLGKPAAIPKLVVDAADEVPPDVRAWEEACDQVRAAKEILDLPAEAFLRYPFPDLAEIVGGVRPGRVHYVVSASNNGKTTFVRSFIDGAIAAGQSCAVMTTETTPDDFRLSLAAGALGLHVGDIATGEYLRHPNAEATKRALSDEMDRWADYENGTHARLRISSASGFLTAASVRKSGREAADIGADWWLIDHADHVQGEKGMSDLQVSNAVNRAIWRACLDLDLRGIAMSQLNQDVFRQNPLALCMTPQEPWVKFGGVKKEIAWVMLGICRQLRSFASEEEREKELAAYKEGARSISDITIPCAHVRDMKHRDYGERVGNSALLEVRNGMYELPSRDVLGDIHGIKTTQDFK